MDRRTALTVLDLPDDADLAALKRRFRALARDRHPDRGGDPAAFQDLHTAFEVLRAELMVAPTRAQPTVARGRPSRRDATIEHGRRLDAAQLDADAAALVARLTEARAVRCVSRAPSARTNRIATSLAAGSTSSIELRWRATPATGRPWVAGVVLTGRGRAARRALTGVDLRALSGVAWARRRGDAITILEAELVGADRAATAHRTLVATVDLLDALAWPLAQWTLD